MVQLGLIILIPTIILSSLAGAYYYYQYYITDELKIEITRLPNDTIPELETTTTTTTTTDEFEQPQSNLQETTSQSKQDRLSLSSFFDFGSPSSGAERIKCGGNFINYDYRIVDGRVAYIGEFPWIVSIQRERNYWFGFRGYAHSCGGSIITESWIVTAAHCLYNRDEPIRIVAGTDNLNFLYKAQLKFPETLIIHPNFDSVTYDYDIALIKVSQPFNLESTFSRVAPICLESNVPIMTYDIATVCGFGAPAFHKQSQSHLYKTDIAIIDGRVCNESFDNSITENMVCAGGMVPQKRDACSGDSGGPLQLEVDDYQSLIGVVSFGNDCAAKGYPGVYTKVAKFYDWIVEQIDETLYEP